MKARIFFAALVVSICGILEGAVMDEQKATAEKQTAWGALGVSQKSYDEFATFWEGLNKNTAKHGSFAVPRVIVWLNGAPGAGKGTNATYICDVFKITQPPLVTSSLLNSPASKKRKDSGELVDDNDVSAVVFEHIFNKKYTDGVVVDGYPRTTVQAEWIKLLHDAILRINQRSDFHVVILNVPEKVSIERQLLRGRQATINNEKVKATGRGEISPIRQTDIDPVAAKNRYQVFTKQSKDGLKVLKNNFPCYNIQAVGSYSDVKAEIYDSLRQK
ncbi:MAG: nucleoside monophosphate kinase [Puniceicoccales bacterium]|nr:nucleoside monophosphate kinase [Puniceicoccales bacterium]